MDRGAWQATVYGVTRVGHDWATKHNLSLRQLKYFVKCMSSKRNPKYTLVWGMLGLDGARSEEIIIHHGFDESGCQSNDPDWQFGVLLFSDL